MSPSLFLLISGIFLSFCLLQSPAAFSADTGQKTRIAEEEAKKLLSGLSDEQARAMLIAELSKAAENQPADDGMKGPAAFFHDLLDRLTGEHSSSRVQVETLLAGIPDVIPNLGTVFLQLCPYSTARGAMLNMAWVFIFLILGAACEWIFRKAFISRLFIATTNLDAGTMNTLEKLNASFARILPDVLGLIIFFITSYLIYFFFIWTDSPYLELFFFASLIAVTVIKAIALLSRIVFSPDLPIFRIVPIECAAARKIHWSVIITCGYIVISLMFIVVAGKLGVEMITSRLLQVLVASLLLIVTGIAVVTHKAKIRQQILTASDTTDQSLTWGRKQFAEIWHILAIAYLGLLWLLLIDSLADTSVKGNGAFILSFFVVPIWMVSDRLIQWIVRYAMTILKIHQEVYEDEEEPDEEIRNERRKGKELFIRVKGIARICVIGALFIWLASLWNIRIPFFSQLAGALLDGLIIMTVALLVWQLISTWTERKIQESLPEEEEIAAEDDEWGGAKAKGRAYTLLPMIRKFIGTILVVMVTLTLLSSMGVDIGPLLAGAGVVGLAIGFGAQKLVSDMFSGFFYLLDDAFRVGEYLSAGSVSGIVESITLRNVMLRHHRGMLQIVPHSELGAITNFMRGGIIVKFNLDFPYDAPIDKIRKVIKKVGQRMLDNEEYGKDFIRPVKSQGVREITNSVMTIRVKFTAQPGTQFVIRREAYRLITEALNAQGIYYAHRKVIVDLPELEADSGEDRKKLITQASGAAIQRAIEEEEQAQETVDKPENGAMG